MDTQSVKRKAAAKEPVPKPSPWRTRSEYCFLRDIRISVHHGQALAWAWTVDDDACVVVDGGEADTQKEARRAGIAAAKKLFRAQIIKPSSATEEVTP